MLAGTAGDWAAVAGRVTYPSRVQVLALAVSLSRPIPGHLIEFGTWQGASTRVIRDELWQSRIWDRRQHGKRIYACDSFKGLAEDYEHLAKGTFATEVPKLQGVRIVNGFFEESLAEQLDKEIGRISPAHLDADRTILKAPPLFPVRLRRRLAPKWWGRFTTSSMACGPHAQGA